MIDVYSNLPVVRRQENMRNLAQGPECHCRSSGSTWDSPCQACCTFRNGSGAHINRLKGEVHKGRRSVWVSLRVRRSEQA